MSICKKEVSIAIHGIMDEKVRFVLDNQLKNRESWKKTVEVFTTHEDSEKGCWRGEYFGKQVRGVELTYVYFTFKHEWIVSNFVSETTLQYRAYKEYHS